jgi:hypothetical protein
MGGGKKGVDDMRDASEKGVCNRQWVYDSSESLETSGHGWSSVSKSIFFDVS